MLRGSVSDGVLSHPGPPGRSSGFGSQGVKGEKGERGPPAVIRSDENVVLVPGPPGPPVSLDVESSHYCHQFS